MSKAAIIIDTISIQEYLFSSNKLKDIIGASNIVAVNYTTILAEITSEKTMDIKAGTQVYLTLNNVKTEVEIVYIGGGNMMLFISSNNENAPKDLIKAFIFEFSFKGIELFPGMKLAFGILHDFNEEEYQLSMSKLHLSLRENRNKVFTQTTPYALGITQNCPLSNGPAAIFSQQYGKNISISAYAKSQFADASFLENCQPPEGYVFAKEFERLCMTSDNRYMAVVHLDGNSMGARLMQATRIEETRQLSEAITSRMRNAINQSLSAFCQLLNTIKPAQDEMGFRSLFTHGESKELPFRPLIAAGDDLTFVCEGRFGIWLTEQILKAFHGVDDAVPDYEFSATAGIVIVNPKYPFNMAYEVCEELCKEAKAVIRGEKHARSLMHFIVASGSLSGGLEIVRETAFRTGDHSLLSGPYIVEGEEKEGFMSLNSIMKDAQALKDNVPRSKMMLLKNYHSLNAQDLENIIKPYLPSQKILQQRQRPGYGNETVIPVHDMLELLDYYPFHLTSQTITTVR